MWYKISLRRSNSENFFVGLIEYSRTHYYQVWKRTFSQFKIILSQKKKEDRAERDQAVSVSKYGGEIKAKSKWMYHLYASYLKTKLKHFTDRNLETLITKYSQFPCSITNSGNRLTFCADLPLHWVYETRIFSTLLTPNSSCNRNNLVT